jgi:hypothetical protein
VRHVHVADDRVGSLRRSRGEPLAAVARRRHLVPGLLERERQDVEELAIVVDQEDARSGHRENET